MGCFNYGSVDVFGLVLLEYVIAVINGIESHNTRKSSSLGVQSIRIELFDWTAVSKRYSSE